MYVFVAVASYRYIKRDLHNNAKSPALPVQRWALVNAGLGFLMTLALLNVYGLRIAFVTGAVVALLVGLVTLAVEVQRGRGAGWIGRTTALAVVSLSASVLLFVTLPK